MLGTLRELDLALEFDPEFFEVVGRGQFRTAAESIEQLVLGDTVGVRQRIQGLGGKIGRHLANDAEEFSQLTQPLGHALLVGTDREFVLVVPDFEFLAVPDTSLNDGGERLALVDQVFVIVDEVIFDDGPPWPVTPDGIGPSLEVIDPALDNSTPRNWHASAAGGGTPGAINSVSAIGLPPWVDGVQHTQSPAPLDPIVVTATVLDATTVDLTYKIDWGVEVPISMLDDGASGDGGAGDGVYGATIPGQPMGTLVRYRISASGPTGAIGGSGSGEENSIGP